MPPSVDGDQTTPVRAHRRLVRLTALGVTVGVAAAAIVGATGANAAAKPLSQSTGRFLSGTFAGTSFDTIAGIEGESASYPADPGANSNSLNAELLNKALVLPLQKGLQLPGLGAIQLGAVAQYAKANKDGSALGASGAVDSNGGIGVGGSDGVPTGGATIDLAGLPGASAVTSIVGDVKLTIGAATARAQQVAIGKTIADPSKSCSNPPYSRVSDKDQAGSYAIAGLKLSATSPLLATLGTTLTNSLGTLLGALKDTDALGTALGGLVTVSGVPTAADLEKDLSVSLAGDSITASLTDGSLTVDVAKLLRYLGLDLNNLCPNTDLLHYVAQALTKLPAALAALVNQVVGKLTTALGAVTITVAGIPLSVSALGGIIDPLVKTLTDTLSTALSTVDTTGLQPLLNILTSTLLNIGVNQQAESGGTLTETALQVTVLPGGTALPAIPTVNPAALTKAAANKAMAPGLAEAKAQAGKTSTSTAPAKFRAATLRAARPLQASRVVLAAAADPALQLNLARATVGPNAAAPTTTSPTPTPTTSVPSTAVPTGVPAGAAGSAGGNSPALPIVLVLIGLVLAGGGVSAYRFRGQVRGRFMH